MTYIVNADNLTVAFPPPRLGVARSTAPNPYFMPSVTPLCTAMPCVSSTRKTPSYPCLLVCRASGCKKSVKFTNTTRDPEYNTCFQNMIPTITPSLSSHLDTVPSEAAAVAAVITAGPCCPPPSTTWGASAAAMRAAPPLQPGTYPVPRPLPPMRESTASWWEEREGLL